MERMTSSFEKYNGSIIQSQHELFQWRRRFFFHETCHNNCVAAVWIRSVFTRHSAWTPTICESSAAQTERGFGMYVIYIRSTVPHADLVHIYTQSRMGRHTWGVRLHCVFVEAD